MAADFLTVEVWTARGLQRLTVLFFLELATRKVEWGGIAADVDGLWMEQVARNLADVEDGRAHPDFGPLGLDEGRYSRVAVGDGLSGEIGSSLCVAPRASLL